MMSCAVIIHDGGLLHLEAGHFLKQRYSNFSNDKIIDDVVYVFVFEMA